MAGETTSEFDLLGFLWRHKAALLVAVVVGAVAGYGLSLLQPERYTATSRVFLSADGPFDPLGQRSGSGQNRFLVQQAQLMTARPLLEAVADAVDVPATRLPEAVETVPSGNTDLISVSATADTPEEAAALADSVPEAYRAFAVARVQETVERALAGVTDPSDQAVIRTAAAVYGDGVGLVEPAAVPSSPSEPQPLRNAVLLAVLAPLAYVLGALLVEGRRRGSGSPRRGAPSGEGQSGGTSSSDLGRGTAPAGPSTSGPYPVPSSQP